jgi:hypothetical protein
LTSMAWGPSLPASADLRLHGVKRSSEQRRHCLACLTSDDAPKVARLASCETQVESLDEPCFRVGAAFLQLADST